MGCPGCSLSWVAGTGSVDCPWLEISDPGPRFSYKKMLVVHSKLAAGSKGFRLMIDKEALVAVHVELTSSRRLLQVLV